jgi:tetratricopeptide (TPR) repeat protein
LLHWSFLSPVDVPGRLMVRFILRSTALVLAVLAGTAALAAPQSTTDSADAAQLEDLLSRGVVLQKAGDLLGAIQNYLVALQIAPDRADIRSNLGAAYVGLGRFSEAIEEYTTALARHDDPSIRLNLALALYKAGRSNDAIPEFQRVLDADPQNRQAPILLADCLLQAGRDREVIELLSPREPMYPDDLAYAYVLGTALLKQDDTARGQVLIDRIFSKGDSAEGHLLMGIAHLNKRDYQNAVTELGRAVVLKPSLPTAQSLYGRALLGSGDREKAVRAFKSALEQQPDDFEANLQLGALYRLDQKFDPALLYLRRAAAVRPDDIAVRHTMAATYLGLGDAEKALTLLEGVTKDVPDFVDGHVLLATTYYRLKRKEDGDRERVIIDRLNAQKQTKQPGASNVEPRPESEPAPPDESSSPDVRPKY